MSTDSERRWKLFEQLLQAEAMGYDVKPEVSNRTLFGIRSTAEQVIDRYVAEAEEERRALLRGQSGAEGRKDAAKNTKGVSSVGAGSAETARNAGNSPDAAAAEAAEYARYAAEEERQRKRYGEWYTRK